MSDRRLERKTKKVSLARLKELLRYDPETGKFVRLIGGRGYRAGEIAGSIKPDTGYISINVDGARYYAHHLAWFYMTGEWPVCLCDHRNRDRSDNRWINLREANGSQNLMNTKLVWSNNTSGVKGVWFFGSRGKWVAEIRVRGQKISLGYYASLEAAADARRVAEVKHFGEFAA